MVNFEAPVIRVKPPENHAGRKLPLKLGEPF
jgi:hypothetical protein